MSVHVSIRLPDVLEQKVEKYALRHRLSRSMAIVVLVEKGLEAAEHNVGQPSTTDLVARLEALEAAIERVGQASTDEHKPPGLSPNHVLGALCHEHHDWQGTGQSRRYRNNNRCVDCANSAKREKRAAGKR
jgi:hypothetical protein